MILLIFMTAAMLACEVAVQNMGTLTPNSTPVIFAARGETEQRWELAVTSGTTYEVILEPQDDMSQRLFVTLTVCHSSSEICLPEDAFASVSTHGNGASLQFTASETGSVYIHYIDTNGEDGQPTGTFAVVVQEIEP